MCVIKHAQGVCGCCVMLYSIYKLLVVNIIEKS